MTKIHLLGVSVNPLTEGDLNNTILDSVSQNKKIVIGHHNLHSIYLSNRDKKMERFYNRADVIYIDGMPIVYWARLLGYKVSRKQRVTGLDWIYSLVSLAEQHSWRIFHLGGKPGIAQIAADRLRAQFPRLAIKVHHGFFSESENDAVIRIINDFNPNILIVGMGMPKQEHWILDNYHNVETNVLLAFGACFDYIAGAIPYPPRWTGRVGLEGVYRLISEPRRLCRRYLIEPFYIIPLMFRDISERLRYKDR